MSDEKKYMVCRTHCISCCVGLRDFTKIYYKHNRSNHLMVCKYDEFLKQERTIKQMRITLDHLMNGDSNKLLELLEFKITNTICALHQDCVIYYLHDHKGNVIDKYCKHFNSLKIYI